MERKIDLVYLWLDGNDKKWRREKQKWLAIESGNAIPSNAGTDEARWRENDELRYSLRSAEKFAPWINHIYIVTGFGHVPKWLNTKHPKITIVDHSEIMPADCLPTFNSGAIEACVTNIPGLSDFFLLANDDMFFGRDVDPSYFFTEKGHPIIWYGKFPVHKNFVKSVKRARTEYRKKLLYNARVIETVFGRKFYNIRPSHNIDAYRKSRIQELLKNPTIEMYNENVKRQRFRNVFTLQRWTYSLYDIAMGRAVTKRMRSHPGTDKKLMYKIKTMLFGDLSDSPRYIEDAMNSKLLKIRPALFCINDTEKTSDEILANNKKFLDIYFPAKSIFEK